MSRVMRCVCVFPEDLHTHQVIIDVITAIIIIISNIIAVTNVVA